MEPKLGANLARGPSGRTPGAPESQQGTPKASKGRAKALKGPKNSHPRAVKGVRGLSKAPKGPPKPTPWLPEALLGHPKVSKGIPKVPFLDPGRFRETSYEPSSEQEIPKKSRKDTTEISKDKASSRHEKRGWENVATNKKR